MTSDHSISKKQIFFLLFSFFPEVFLDAVMFPLFPVMVRYYFQSYDNTGYYTGIMGSAFWAPLFITNAIWGSLSDKYGVRPILMSAIVFGALSSISLGLATTFWVACCARVVQGIFGANSTVAKGKIGGISNPVTRAWGYSMYGLMHSVAQIIGPPIGGLLYDTRTILTSNGTANIQPSPNPHAMPDFYRSHPFLLACGSGTLFFVISFIVTSIFLEEQPRHSKSEELELNSTRSSSPRHTSMEINRSSPHKRNNTGASKSGIRPGEATGTRAKRSALHNAAIIPIILYCMTACVNMIYQVSIALFLSSKPEKGGLEFTPTQISIPVSAVAISGLVIQLSPFYKLIAKYGSNVCYIAGMTLYIPTLAAIPFIGIIINDTSAQLISMIICGIFLGAAETISYQAVIVMISESVPLHRQGLTQGVASTASAAMRMLSPALAGVLWEVGVAMGISSFVFGVCICVVAVGIGISVIVGDRERFGEGPKYREVGGDDDDNGESG